MFHDLWAVGKECRDLRQQAHVSLEDMARRLHRDASSLSRFERGQSTPRDVDRVVGAYRSLQRRATDTPQPKRGLRAVVWAMLARWVVFGLCEARAATTGSKVAAAEVLRLFVVGSTVGALVYGAYTHFVRPRYPWFPLQIRAAIVTRTMAPMVLLASYLLTRPNAQHLMILPAAACLVLVEMSFVIWGYEPVP